MRDSNEIKLSSQRSENLEFGLESSSENDESVVKPNYSKNPDSYRQVCVPDEELDNSPVLNWTRVRSSFLAEAYRRKLDFMESQRLLNITDLSTSKISCQIPNTLWLRSLKSFLDFLV